MKKKLTKLEAEVLIKYASVTKEIFQDWKPFPYQKIVLEDLFIKQKKYVFCNWARKSGKSEIGAYFLILKALMIPMGVFYYISKTQENAKQVIWNRFKRILPRQYIKPGSQGIKESSLSIHFTNGSVIYLLGSNMDTDSLIGTEPDSVIYDEFRTHNPSFHEVMSPNFHKDHCQCLIISTPPDLLDIENGKCFMYELIKQMCIKDLASSYYTLSCWEGNPKLQDFYIKEKERYQFLGKELEFQREYEAKFIKGTRLSMLPEFNHKDLVSKSYINDKLKSITNLKWVIGGDTSGNTRWGILFGALDLNTKILYILDCITIVPDGKGYEDRKKVGMTAYQVWPPVEKKLEELNPNSTHTDWDIVWDRDNHILDEIYNWYGSDININIVNKKTMGKSDCLNLIRDLKLLNKIVISESASELIDEFQSLELNRKSGEPYKTYDELIDCLRYIIYENDDLFDCESLKSKIVVEQTKEEVFLNRIEKKSLKPKEFKLDFLDNEYYNEWL